jgi:hypothetical protein
MAPNALPNVARGNNRAKLALDWIVTRQPEEIEPSGLAYRLPAALRRPHELNSDVVVNGAAVLAGQLQRVPVGPAHPVLHVKHADPQAYCLNHSADGPTLVSA